MTATMQATIKPSIRPNFADVAAGPDEAVDVAPAAWRDLYLRPVLGQIPRMLGAVDRNPFQATYGCFDREYWHYRTAAFPSQMHQEAVLPLAIVAARPFPGNRWHDEPRVKQLVHAGLRFAARSSHRDGSCDDYYPFERAYGAAVFVLVAAGRAMRILEIDDDDVRRWLKQRARWVAAHNESGRLANHHALAALGLLHASQVLDDADLAGASEQALDRVLAWQDDEGWFCEYEGADPGYQTVTIDCLAQLRHAIGHAAPQRRRLDEALLRAVDFAAWFVHPDGSYGGEYGSRGTQHFYPFGFEALARESTAAAALADAFLKSVGRATTASFADDRMYVHRLASCLDAWHASRSRVRSESRPTMARRGAKSFPAAGLFVVRRSHSYTVASTARGGIVKHFADGDDVPAFTDAGLVVELDDGRVGVSQMHDAGQPVTSRWPTTPSTTDADRNDVEDRRQHDGPTADNVPTRRVGTLETTRALMVAKPRRASPVTQAMFHLGMVVVGRWARTFVRLVLQRLLITGRRTLPIQHTRRVEVIEADGEPHGAHRLKIVDRLRLDGRRIRVRRLAFGVDHQSAYVAACGVYQDAALQCWTSLDEFVAVINHHRSLTVTREIGVDGRVTMSVEPPCSSPSPEPSIRDVRNAASVVQEARKECHV